MVSSIRHPLHIVCGDVGQRRWRYSTAVILHLLTRFYNQVKKFKVVYNEDKKVQGRSAKHPKPGDPPEN
jgi:hypothetical protein